MGNAREDPGSGTGVPKRIAPDVRKWALRAFVVTLGIGGVAWLAWPRPEVTPAIRGARLARSTGCLACHGEGALGGVADPRASARNIPGWEPGTAEMYVTSREEIREWILYGAPRDRDPHLDPARLISMPAYEGVLSERETEDLVAYFVAVSGWDPGIPDAAFEGRKVAERLGCFGCHGPSGMGGVANPGSFKGEIPPWDGEDFARLVRDEHELREWILDGGLRRLERNPLARYFLTRQIIRMPGYRDSLSEEELDRIVAYIRWLRERS